MPREGRPPKLTDQIMSALIRETTKRPKITLKELQSGAWWWQHHAVGMFSSAGTGKLVRIEGMIDGTKCREILEGKPVSVFQRFDTGRRFTFQQDNDLKHTAKATLEWFKGKHLNVLEWPSQSPDLNPIEKLWSDLKIAVHQRNPSNLKELELFCL